jgi:hypothetical protein
LSTHRYGLVGPLSPRTYLRRYAVTKGVAGGSKTWMVLAVFLWAPRLTRRAFGRTQEVVAVERLRPGQIVRIEALTNLTKAERKAIRKAK